MLSTRIQVAGSSSDPYYCRIPPVLIATQNGMLWLSLRPNNDKLGVLYDDDVRRAGEAWKLDYRRS